MAASQPNFADLHNSINFSPLHRHQPAATQSLSMFTVFARIRPPEFHNFSPQMVANSVSFFSNRAMEAIDEKKNFLASPILKSPIFAKSTGSCRKFALTIVALGLLSEFSFVHVIFTFGHVG